MKQLFSVYPAGAAGAGLLLLRLSIALFLVSALPAEMQAVHPLPPWAVVALDLVSLSIAFGICTRSLVALCAIVGATTALAGGFETAPFLIVQILNAAALALIGPGAFSIDARLFGRSTITFPN